MVDIKKYFLLARPYSLVDIVLVGLLANLISSDGLFWNFSLLIDISVAVCWWFSFNLLRESVKTKCEIYPSLMFLAMLILLIVLKNPIVLLLLFINLVWLYLYSLKVKSSLFGVISSVNRSLLTIILLAMILALNNRLNIEIISINLPVILSLFLLVMSRNLLADIRDYGVDKLTFPKKFGKKISFIVVDISVLIICILIKDLSVIFPLLLLFLIILFYRNAYFLHRIYIITSMFFLANYILSVINIPILINNLLYIGILLNFTYDFIPRTLYRKRKQKRNVKMTK